MEMIMMLVGALAGTSFACGRSSERGWLLAMHDAVGVHAVVLVSKMSLGCWQGR
jgi:hypothetical protein